MEASRLNGRPYVVGHVPKSLNSREAEFEGLLRGDNSIAKMTSLCRDGPVKREVTNTEPVLVGSSPPQNADVVAFFSPRVCHSRRTRVHPV